MPTYLDSDAVLSPSPPFTRDSSPSPSATPSTALSAASSVAASRCFSTASTVSTVSDRSDRSSTSRTSSVFSRRRGYVRTQGTDFAASAKHRNSVMNLGSIAHLQYYFARTGMLDGKGGQLARGERSKLGGGSRRASADQFAGSESEFGSPSPVGFEDDGDYAMIWEEATMLLPPTVSTYNDKVVPVASPPDAKTMEEDLKKSLADVAKTLDGLKTELASKGVNELSTSSAQEISPPTADQSPDSIGESTASPTLTPISSSQGWYQIQGMHLLDVVTLAIRAAKIYYTQHEHPQRLSSIKSERQIRDELLGVMDVLKRMAARTFAGGIKHDELHVIDIWVINVNELLRQEKEIEGQERRDRESWKWLEGDWEEGDKEREWLFLQTFWQMEMAKDSTLEELPRWVPLGPTVDASEASTEKESGEIPTSCSTFTALPSQFLSRLRNGLALVKLHNRILKTSRRQFGEIRTWHTDTAKPYRAAENLRFWIKAAEIRWEVKLQQQVNVMAIVLDPKEEHWRGFDEAIAKWCRTVREEITKEWKMGSVIVDVQGP
ncbi:hypothetical protein MMC25_003005 [Agyrium rufum]|nr:hypothetical protein [Agyrium rufum]